MTRAPSSTIDARREALRGIDAIAVDVIIAPVSESQLGVSTDHIRQMAELMLRIVRLDVVERADALQNSTSIIQLVVSDVVTNGFGTYYARLSASLLDVVSVKRNGREQYASTWSAAQEFKAPPGSGMDSVRFAVSAVLTGFCNDLLAANGPPGS